MSAVACALNANKAGRVVDSAIYDDLLCRFERLLAFSETLQTRLRQENRRTARLQDLARQNSRLKARVGLDEVYIALLEQSLDSLGALEADSVTEAVTPVWPPASRRKGTDPSHRLHLASPLVEKVAR